MDIEKELDHMQFLSVFGIYKESYKLISSRAKFFSKITLASILPLSFLFLANVVLDDAMKEPTTGTAGTGGTPANYFNGYSVKYWIFKAIYFTLVAIFSLISLSSVVHTVACAYTTTSSPVNVTSSFKKVIMSVVPKVWKRLVVTSLCMFTTFFMAALSLALIAGVAFVFFSPQVAYSTVVIMAIIYLVGFLYLSIIWPLASVVCILEEDIYGFRAMRKSKDLLKGKMIAVMIIFVTLGILFGFVQFVFGRFVVTNTAGGSSAVVVRTGVAILCLLLHSMVLLFNLVTHTVLYFVCKSYHHEKIDKSVLLEEYAPLPAEDVQVEHFIV